MSHALDVQRARRILLTQIVLALVLALSLSVFDSSIGRDALLGGVAAVAGSAIFIIWSLGRYNAAKPGQIVARLYSGELLKILAIVAVFGIAIKTVEGLNPVALFGGFFIAHVLPPLLANKIAR